MSAIYSVLPERVNVTIFGRLGYTTWRVLRDARIAALERRLPLHLNLSGCRGGDMGGLGALMIAQHQLGEISIDGCDQNFASWFSSIGVCNRCCGGDQNCAGRAGNRNDAQLTA